ncbi:hypothetical protein QFZ80_000164 [Paenibacillus sp. V4I7]|nr:hypothetical protein [Paenibacillus sp. V4I7]
MKPFINSKVLQQKFRIESFQSIVNVVKWDYVTQTISRHFRICGKFDSLWDVIAKRVFAIPVKVQSSHREFLRFRRSNWEKYYGGRIVCTF